jgi:hypothetical protein
MKYTTPMALQQHNNSALTHQNAQDLPLKLPPPRHLLYNHIIIQLSNDITMLQQTTHITGRS